MPRTWKLLRLQSVIVMSTAVGREHGTIKIKLHNITIGCAKLTWEMANVLLLRYYTTNWIMDSSVWGEMRSERNPSNILHVRPTVVVCRVTFFLL